MKKRRKTKQLRRPRRLKLLGLQSETQQVRARRSCVMIQIDGLSYRNFNEALLRGNLRFLHSLLQRGLARKGSWRSMLPTSTGAFQTGLFYGNNDNVPGFFWYDKKAGKTVSLNTIQGALELQESLCKTVAPYPGLISGGSAYCALFTGGASCTLLTFARLLRPSLNLSTKPRWLLVFFVMQFVLIARIVYYATVEVLVATYDLVCALFTEKNKYLEFRFLVARIATTVLCREIATLAAILDIYRGAGPIYINHVAYDEHAHHRGPSSKFAAWSLKGIDASIHRVWKAIERAKRSGIREYDLYVWSDHGQTDTVPFHELFDQEPELHFELLFKSLHDPNENQRAEARQRRERERIRRRRVLRGQQRRYSSSRLQARAAAAEGVGELLPSRLSRLYRWLLRPSQRAPAPPHESGDGPPRVVFVSTGPVAHFYLLDDKEPLAFDRLMQSCPQFMQAIAEHKGVGFALARARSGGAMIGVGGHWVDIHDDAALNRLAPDIVSAVHQSRAELIRWINMPSAGDLLLFGYRGPAVPSISYTYERGGHAGPSLPERTPFLMVPADRADLWPELGATGKRRIELRDLHVRLRDTYGVTVAPAERRNVS